MASKYHKYSKFKKYKYNKTSKNIHFKKRFAKKKTYSPSAAPLELIVVNIVAVGLIVFLILFIKDLSFTPKKRVSIPAETVAAFQIPQKTMTELKTLSEKYSIEYPEILAVYSLENNFFPTKATAPSVEEIEQSFIINYSKIKKGYSDKTINTYKNMFENILSEIKYFPIPSKFDKDETPSYMFGDSFKTLKNKSAYKGFEGTDIHDRENISGRIPIVSMTNGTVENAGWSEELGYYIEIKGDKNTIYTYSHFESLLGNIIKGVNIQAGQPIGYMGNTGNGKKAGEKSALPVHLHLGISPSTKIGTGMFYINPYPFLRLIEGIKIEKAIIEEEK